jgi:hypothetical protein
MLHSKLALVVAEVFPSKQKGEFEIILLFLHRHLLKLWPISSNKLGQLVDDILQLLIWVNHGRQKTEFMNDLLFTESHFGHFLYENVLPLYKQALLINVPPVIKMLYGFVFDLIKRQKHSEFSET